jgi:hypothetical protein
MLPVLKANIRAGNQAIHCHGKPQLMINRNFNNELKSPSKTENNSMLL